MCKLGGYVFAGSPFLANEDGVLGGIIVLRCCRCGEDHSSGNLQALLGMFCASNTAQHSHFGAIIYFINTVFNVLQHSVFTLLWVSVHGQTLNK